MSRIALAVALVVLAAPLGAVAEDDDQAGRILAAGDELRDRGRCEEAIDHYRSGLAVFPHWMFVLRIADCYRLMGQPERALPYLRRELPSVRRDWGAEDALVVERAIDECLAALPARLAVSSNAPGATVLLNGTPIGRTPLEREVEAGPHTVEVRGDGTTARRAEITARRGETVYVALDLVRLGRAPGDERPSPEAGAGRRHLLWGGLMLGAGLLLAGGGATLAVLDGRELGNDATFSLDTLGPGVLLVALGVGLSIGGGVLFGIPPAGQRERDQEEEDEEETEDLGLEPAGRRRVDGDPLQ